MHSPTHASSDEDAAEQAEITARVQQELQRFLNHTAVGIHWVGPDGTILWANETELNFLGYTREEYVGRNIVEFHVDRAVIDTILQRLTAGDTLLDYGACLRHKDGSVREVQINANVLWRGGEFLHTQCFTRDVTATHAAAARRAARDHFLLALDDSVRPLSDAADITFTAASALGQFLRVNRCAYAIVESDQDSFELTGNYSDGVPSIVGHYTFTQFGQECLRLMRAGQPYVVVDAEADPRITAVERPSYEQTNIRGVICVPILKHGQFVAAMAVHSLQPRQWLSDEVELVQHVASRCWESIERTRVTQSLVESGLQYLALANSIPNLAWMARPDGWIYWFNDQWYAYTGSTPEAMEGWGWQSVHDPARLAEVTERWQQSIASGTPFEMVFPLRGADGEFRRFLTRVNPVHDSQGAVAHWFGTNTDVEGERRATEANALLRAREQAAREDAELQKRVLYSLFMQAPTLIAVLRGPRHVVALANPPVCRVWARSEESLIDRPLFEAMPEFVSQGFREFLDEVYRTGVARVGTETPAVIDRPGGGPETRYFNFVHSPFRNIDGAIEGIFMIASDVTEQVLARNQVNSLREAAEAANRAKDEFLAMLGHELRNPLAPIVTALHLMKLRGGEGDDERTIIERQVNHLTRLVDDLLDISRITSGKVRLRVERVELSDVVAKAIEMASPLLERASHRLDVLVPKEGLAVDGDPVRLSQAVANLLTNAAKYTPRQGQVTVRAAVEAGEVTLRVIDNGIGIAPDMLPHVFNLFTQARQGSDRAAGGLGLGLTIVQSLVDRHGGSVTALSGGMGQGSEFVISLPKASATHPRQLGPAIGVPEADSPRAQLRILIVDDNADGAEMLSRVLNNDGHHTRVAHDATAALQAAEAFGPEVAILDLGLPVIDGYELAARLRSLPGLTAVRLIALTGYGQDSDVRKTRASGFEAHLVKPVDFARVRALLDGRPIENAGELRR